MVGVKDDVEKNTFAFWSGEIRRANTIRSAEEWEIFMHKEELQRAYPSEIETFFRERENLATWWKSREQRENKEAAGGLFSARARGFTAAFRAAERHLHLFLLRFYRGPLLRGNL